MVKSWKMVALVGLALGMGAAAQAGVVCQFTDSGLSGGDCLGQTWNVGTPAVFNNQPVWSLPPPGQGQGGQAFAGVVATDFHFRCLAGCGRIRNGAGDPTYFLSVGNLEFWSESVSAAGDSIDFNFQSAGGILNTGSRFDINIAFESLDLAAFRFEAAWTDDHRRVDEPDATTLVGLALLALFLARAGSTGAGQRWPGRLVKRLMGLPRVAA